MGYVLIGYATRTGAAADVAQSMADVFREAGHGVRVANLAEEPAIDAADLIILGSGVNTGAWYPEALAWIRGNAKALGAARVAVFNTCLNAADPEKREVALGYNDSVVGRCGAVASEAFAGRFVPARVSLLSRIFAKLRGHGDDDHVDPTKARAWATDLLTLLPI